MEMEEKRFRTGPAGATRKIGAPTPSKTLLFCGPIYDKYIRMSIIHIHLIDLVVTFFRVIGPKMALFAKCAPLLASKTALFLPRRSTVQPKSTAFRILTALPVPRLDLPP
jgi:hypothetical protein